MNMTEEFARDVQKGLSSDPKYLESKYFYDSEGDKLFQKIMGLSEYYLTDCEFEILHKNKERLLEAFIDKENPFLLTELGAGDGLKTKLLLRHFKEKKARFAYLPNDISIHVLNILKHDLSQDIPGIEMRPYPGDYFKALHDINQKETDRKVVLFLGSTIGNFNLGDAADFLKELNRHLNGGDQLVIGFDLKKDPHVILRAYNDPTGITASFNLNLLHRINKELEGEFILDNFYHYPIYNPLSGETRSFLISRIAQSVRIGHIGRTFDFKMGEPISMEISQKYDTGMIGQLATQSGFRMKTNFFDSRKYFVDSLWEKV